MSRKQYQVKSLNPGRARKLTLASRRYRAKGAWNSYIRTKEAFRLHQQTFPCIPLYHIENVPRNERHLIPYFSQIALLLSP